MKQQQQQQQKCFVAVVHFYTSATGWHYVFRLSVSVSDQNSCYCQVSRWSGWVFFGFIWNDYCNRQMNWLDFGIHPNRAKVITSWNVRNCFSFYSFLSVEVYFKAVWGIQISNKRDSTWWRRHPLNVFSDCSLYAVLWYFKVPKLNHTKVNPIQGHEIN